MLFEIAGLLARVNDVLQSAIVIFGASVALYNLRYVRRDRVSRAFTSLISFVIIAYFTELIASQTDFTASAESWLRLEWIGIVMVPAAQFHLADALLATTGDVSRRRRRFVRVWYLTGVTFLLMVIFSDWIASGLANNNIIRHMRAGPLFPIFVLYFWVVAGTSMVYVWRARRRCVTTTLRRRMTVTALVFMAAPISVFPYLIISSLLSGTPVLLWLLVILGNLIVGAMFAFMTANLAYFGATSTDRIVRIRLYKYMARVPLAATAVLLVYVLVSRGGFLLGLPTESALAIAVVATVILVEAAIHIYKRPLERVLRINKDPDVNRIQELSERILTTRELHEYLESLLATICSVTQSPTAFVAAMTPDGPSLEVVVGPLEDVDNVWQDADWDSLTPDDDDESEDVLESDVISVDSFFVWNNFWIQPLYGQRRDHMLGILGMRARAESPDLSADELPLYKRLRDQAAAALEDRILQQEVFAAVEGLLPEIIALQQQRSAAAYTGAGPELVTAELLAEGGAESGEILTDPDFNSLVRDALSHYWGGPKLTNSPLLRLRVVQNALDENDGNPTRALRAILAQAIELQKPEGERNLTTAEWILYNILELKFVQGRKVRTVARRLAMSESDLYRKQRVAIENVANTINNLEQQAVMNGEEVDD